LVDIARLIEGGREAALVVVGDAELGEVAVAEMTS
jgi:hypothetical protein